MTVNMKLGEVIVDAIVAKLKANMATRVATINAAHSDFSIAAPGNADYYVGGVNEIPNAPALIISEGPTTLDNALEGPHSLVTDTDVIVYVLEQDPDRQTLVRKLQRQARAVIESIWDSDPLEALTGSAYRIIPYRIIPGRAFDPEKDDVNWRAFYLVVFRATQLEGT